MTTTERENKIKDLKGKLKNVRSKKQLYLIRKEISKLEKFQNKIVLEHLLNNDINFKEVSEKNLEFLNNGYLAFPYKEGGNLLSSNTRIFTGFIKNNGYLYLSADSVGIEFFDQFFHWAGLIGFRLYPKSYIGKIDSMGFIDLKLNRYGFSIIGDFVPKEYKLTINDSGDVELTTSKKEFSFFKGEYVSKIIVNICDKDYQKLKTLNNNLSKAKNIVKNFRDNLISVGNTV
jgi:hypothetical protein